MRPQCLNAMARALRALASFLVSRFRMWGSAPHPAKGFPFGIPLMGGCAFEFGASTPRMPETGTRWAFDCRRAMASSSTPNPQEQKWRGTSAE
jgi:hypothetical protein